jgi:hypothetical protein
VKERFDEGIVAELARGFHALGDPEGCQASPEGIAGVFHSAIGMENQLQFPASTQLSTIEGVEGQRQIARRYPARAPPAAADTDF